MTSEVHAINFDPYKWNGTQIGSNNGLTFYGDEEKTFDIDLEYFGSISDEMSEKYGLLKAWNGSGGSNGTTYNFLITACSADISFERFANRHNYIVKSVYSNTPCKTQDGWNRKLEYHFVKMTPTGYNVGNSDTFTVTWNTTVTFKNKYSWANLFEITNVDILTDDEFKSLMNEYENISKLEEQIQSMRDTNAKLDASIQQQQALNDKLNQQMQQDKEQHDEFMDSDISEEDKTLPDDSKYQDYTNTEDSLKDKVNQADMSVISIGIDANSSAWVWDTLTRLIQSNSIIFGMFISILSIGIIKLALGR